MTPSRALTGFRENERLRVKLEREKEHPRDPLDSKLALEPLTAAIVAPVAAWLVGELVGMVEKAFAREQKQHLGAYTVRLVIPDFHARLRSSQPAETGGDTEIVDDGQTGRIRRIVLERSAASSPEEDPGTASRIVLGVETEAWSGQGPGLAMRFDLLGADVLRSKAKVTEAVWYNPFSYGQSRDAAWWTVWRWWADNDEPLIRLEISVSAEAIWFSDQRTEKALLGETTFSVSRLPVGRTGALEREGKTLQGPWLPIVPWTIVEGGSAPEPAQPGVWGMEEVSLQARSQASAAAGRGGRGLVSGLFLLSISIVEIDENSRNSEQLSRLLKSIRENLSKAVEKKIKG